MAKERVILGYWKPRGLVSKAGETVTAFKTQFGIALYEDDPVHKALFEAGTKRGSSYEFWIAGVINSANTKQETKELNLDSL